MLYLLVYFSDGKEPHFVVFRGRVPVFVCDILLHMFTGGAVCPVFASMAQKTIGRAPLLNSKKPISFLSDNYFSTLNN